MYGIGQINIRMPTKMRIVIILNVYTEICVYI